MPVHPIRDTDNVVEIGHCDQEETTRKERKNKMNYKDTIQEYADEIAEKEHGKDFYDLSEKEQDKVYKEAQEMYVDDYTSQIDKIS